MKFRFQTYVDVSTSATSMQVLQFSVGGSNVLNRCRHLFGAYKYFKLGKISVKMVPASTLPVDPLQLSYDTTDPQSVDPRDQMNPGLVRITNGEDVFTDVSSLTADEQNGIYKTMMLDPRWSKFMLQSGFRRSAYPLYWQIGQLHQDRFPGAIQNEPYTTGTTNTSFDSRAVRNSINTNFLEQQTIDQASSPRGLFQVGHRGRLGFLPTDYYQITPSASSPTTDVATYGINNIPVVQVITCVLPKAFKTLYYYRIYVTEEVIFSGLRSGPAIAKLPGSTANGLYTGIDQFVISHPIPSLHSFNLINYPMNNGQGSK